MAKFTDSTVLNLGSIASFVAFAFFILGLRGGNRTFLILGFAAMIVAMATPFIPYVMKKIRGA